MTSWIFFFPRLRTDAGIGADPAEQALVGLWLALFASAMLYRALLMAQVLFMNGVVCIPLLNGRGLWHNPIFGFSFCTNQVISNNFARNYLKNYS